MIKKIKLKKIFLLSIIPIINIIFSLVYAEEEGRMYLFIFLLASSAYSIFKVIRSNDVSQIEKNSDAGVIFELLMLVWTIFREFLDIGDPVLYPKPREIAFILVNNFPKFLDNVFYSLSLIVISFIFGMITAFPLGVLLGKNKRIMNALDSYIKIISPIPIIAYIPYVIAIMPGFRQASIFIIFLSVFWPILKWTIFGVYNFDTTYILNSQLLGFSKWQYLSQVLIPGMMPSVLSGVSQSISGGFAALVAAEMLGSRKGLGYNIKYYSDFLNYHQVLSGILYLGVVITFTLWIFEKINNRLLNWQQKDKK